MFTNSLTEAEVVATLCAVERLRKTSWAAGLLEATRRITDRLRVRFTDLAAYVANPVSPSDVSFLFEIRFARALADAGLTASYEHKAGVGNSSVDFRIDLDPPWLVELVSFRESAAVRTATRNDGPWSRTLLSTHAEDPRQSVEGEFRQAQTRIGAKVMDRHGKPVKFPVPGQCIHMVMVDARGYLDGHGDESDFRQMLHGPEAVKSYPPQCWTDDSTGTRSAIRGWFETQCVLPSARFVQERLHVIGFTSEKKFDQHEIASTSWYLRNPHLVPSCSQLAIPWLHRPPP